MTGAPRAKILFVMLHAGFVRNYESTLRWLTERGHRIHVAYELDRNKFGENVQIARLAAEYPAITFGSAPANDAGALANLARVVRTLVDYLRYLDPAYAGAASLRQRVEEKIPSLFRRTVRFVASCGAPARRLMLSALRAAERAIPPSPVVVAFVRAQNPDLVLVTPLVDFGSDQVDYVKAARMLGVPSGLCVASWDNLTNKGLMRVVPDRVFVWNEAQKDEAVMLHGAPPASVVTTGAQLFDHWFEWRPSRSRDTFCETVGLDPSKPFILYLGSSYFIAPDEAPFADRWIRRLRADVDPVLAGAGVLIRPHPSNAQQWLAFDFEPLGNVAIWPRFGADPFAEEFKRDFYDSLHYSSVVVGVNTSALIEAGIVGRPVCTVLAGEFAHSQEGTLHFRHLTQVKGGLLHTASTMEEHIEQLRAALTGPGLDAEKSRRFVEAFVRPHGLGVPATPILGRALESLCAERPAAVEPAAGFPVRMAVSALAWIAARLWHPGRKLQRVRQVPWWVSLLRPLVFVAVCLVSARAWALAGSRTAVLTAIRAGENAAKRWRRLVRQGRGVSRDMRRSLGELSKAMIKVRKRSNKIRRQAAKRARIAASRTFGAPGRRS